MTSETLRKVLVAGAALAALSVAACNPSAGNNAAADANANAAAPAADANANAAAPAADANANANAAAPAADANANANAAAN